MASFVAQTATTSLNTRSTQVFTKMVPKTAKEWAAACNPQALAKSLTWATTISSIHLLYFSLLGISLTCKKLELLNVDKLHIFRNITSIKYLRGTIGWGICSIDNIHELHIMPASCNIFHGNLWGNKIFLKISDINFFKCHEWSYSQTIINFFLLYITLTPINLPCDQFHPHVLLDGGILSKWYISKWCRHYPIGNGMTGWWHPVIFYIFYFMRSIEMMEKSGILQLNALKVRCHHHLYYGWI